MQQNLFVGIMVVIIAIFVGLPAFSQPSLAKMQQKLAAEKQNTTESFYKFDVSSKMKTQAGILFSLDRAVSKNSLQSWLNDKLVLRPRIDTLLEKGTISEYQGTQISKLQQYYKGIKVEHGVISKVTKGDKVLLLQMEFYPIPENLPTKAIFGENDALQKALDFIDAKRYVWQGYTGRELRYQKPKGELVIVEDMYSEGGVFCLAYKFDVYASEPLGRKLVYVNAVTGKIAFSNDLLKHSDNNKTLNSNKINTVNKLNQFGTTGNSSIKTIPKRPLQAITGTKELGGGFSRYSGALAMFTTKDDATGKYSLLAEKMGDNTTVETLDLQQRENIATAVPIIDDDNYWSEPSSLPGFPDIPNMVIDAHWATQKVVSYWWDKHQRKSYDNNNGKINCYIHYKPDSRLYDNAQWNGNEILCGDGNDGYHPHVTTDIISHEFGHAICQFTAGLVYNRESGALNEGFSDIWAACFDNYTGLGKDIWRIGEEIYPDAVPKGFRSMASPYLYGDPDTYLTDPKWKDVSKEGCPIINKLDYPPASQDGNDNCGVHYNSSVLNKWFYLITNGGALTNWNFYNYSVSPMGFDKTEKLAFYTEQILTPNSGFEAAKIASLNAAVILGFNADIPNINEAWKAVGIYSDSIYNTTNTPVFGTNDFKAIGVGKYGHVWVGTANNGVFKYNGVNWVKSTELLNHNIADIKPDKDGRIWIAQYGRNGVQSLNGGISCFRDTSFSSYKLYNSKSTDGISSKNMRSLFINNNVEDTFKRVWTAAMADVLGDTSHNGGVYMGNRNERFLDYNYKPFLEIEAGVNQTVGGLCQTIGGGKDEVWVFASTNSTSGGNQLLRYKTEDGSYIGFADNTNSTLPAGFNAKAIYFDSVGHKWWIGMLSGGVYVYDVVTPGWTQVNFSSLFPAGTIVNNNAITGDSLGNVYIGTNNGLIKLGTSNASGGSLNPFLETSYKRFTTAEGLPSNNVKAIAVDDRSSRLLLATDNGIVFKYTLCRECINTSPVYTLYPGNWDDPTSWSNGKVPGPNTSVVLKHSMIITQNASCKTLKVVGPGGAFAVNAGINFKVIGEKHVTE